MVSNVRRWLVTVLVLMVLVLFAAGVHVRGLWQEWAAKQAIQSLDWQGLSLSLGGVQADEFSLVIAEGRRPLQVQGSQLQLGWNWTSLTLTEVRVEQLEAHLPAWPLAQARVTDTAPLRFPQSLPAWVPKHIMVQQLQLSLPGGLDMRGDLSLTLAANPEQWRAETEQTWFTGVWPEQRRNGWVLRNTRARVGVSGVATSGVFELSLLPGSVLQVEDVDGPVDADSHAGGDNGLWLDNLELRPGQFRLGGQYNLQEKNLGRIGFSGDLKFDAQRLHHPQLITQSWQAQGRLEGARTEQGAGQVEFIGKLSSAAGIVMDLSFLSPLRGMPRATATYSADGQAANQALAGTVQNWPGELEVTQGRVGVQAKLRLPKAAPELDIHVQTQALSGVFNRTAFTGLSGDLAVSVADTLVAETSDLKLARLNPGVEVGPITVSGRYDAGLENPLQGFVSLVEGRAQVFGGEAWVQPGEWNLGQLPATVSVELTGLQLAEILQAYPLEGLEGNGTLQGRVPLLIGAAGIAVSGGSVTAQAPGGKLKLPAERLQALAQGNDSMRLVVQALQNFQYNLLESRIDYDQQGLLNLGLRLKGRNPEVREGHPIVLNVNLEENIPALLTSLQLSGRVNEAVTEKVRSMLQQREAAGSGQP